VGDRSTIERGLRAARGSSVAVGMSSTDGTDGTAGTGATAGAGADATVAGRAGCGSTFSAGDTVTLGRADRIAELVLAGLAEDEDELLGDLTEGRTQIDALSGAVVAKRWWRRQVVRAVPRLVVHAAARHTEWLLLGGVAGAVAGLAVMTALGAGVTARAGDLPPVSTRAFVLAVVGHGLALVLAGAVGGVVAAVVARRAPLLAAAGLGAVNGLTWLSHPYYSAYGAGQPTPDGGRVITFSPTSPDLLFPVLWELPTMAILMSMATIVGGLLAVGWSRSRRRAVVR